jgi:putative transcriptional regulator
MADHFQTGVKPGDLLVSHPHWSDTERVCLITERTHASTVALELNTPANLTFAELVLEQGYAVSLDEAVYHGGDYNTHSLILLHDSNWYSSNTMPVNSEWSISSDYHMIDKLADGNTPDDFRVMIGISAWAERDLDQELAAKRSPWLVLKQPNRSLIMSDPEDQYTLALDAFIKQNVNYFFD